MTEPSLLRRIYLLAASAQPGNAPEVCEKIRQMLEPDAPPAPKRYYRELRTVVEQVRETGTLFIAGDDRWLGHSIRLVARRAQLRVRAVRIVRSGKIGYLVTLRSE